MLNIKNTLHFILVVTSYLLISNAVMAANFVANVGIDYTHLHQLITYVKVTCRVQARGSETRLPLTLAIGHATGTVIDGSVHQQFNIALRDMPNTDPSTAYTQACSAKICTANDQCEVLRKTPRPYNNYYPPIVNIKYRTVDEAVNSSANYVGGRWGRWGR